MAYILTPGFAGVDLDEVSSGAVVPVGTEVIASDGNTYKYVLNNGSAALLGEAHYLDENGYLTGYLRTSTLPAGAIGIAYVTQTQAVGQYAWVVIKGIDFIGQPLAGAAQDAKLYSSATSTFPDDDSLAGSLIAGLRANTTGTGNDISCSNAGISEINAQD